MKKAILTVLMTSALAVGSAQAAIVFGNLGATGSGNVTASGGRAVNYSNWAAVGFTPAGSDLTLSSATIGLVNLSGTSATVRLDIFTGTSAPNISNSVFNTSVTLAANAPSQKFTFDLGGTTLNAGTTYWINLQQTAGLGTAIFWRQAVSNVIPTTQNASGWANLGANTLQRTANAGGTWTTITTPISLSIDASPIPEPGTWAAMAIFASGAAYAGWRRRQQQLA